MTNEELAIEIQNGKTEYLPALWERVECFVALKANRLLKVLGDNRIEFDDLYNSAYLYLQKAVDYFDPEKECSFLNMYSSFFLKKAFAEATGIRLSKERNDPLKRAMSLDAPIKEGEEATYGDMIADDVDIADDVIEGIVKRELHNDLEAALSKLETSEEKVIRSYYYDRLDLQEIGKEMDITSARVGQIKSSALRKLRRPEVRKDLEKYIDFHTNFYLRVGAKSQKSPVELIVLQREELRNRDPFLDKF